eukprot:scaffold415961_cov31-Attheya_sp.AAC.1
MNSNGTKASRCTRKTCNQQRRVFWLLSGHNQIDPKYVQDTFKRVTQVDLEMRLKKIKDGSAYGTPEEEKHRKAWHVNVDTQSAHQ